MKGLYIGIGTPGTTSLMRFKTLENIRPQIDWDLLNTDETFLAASRIHRSVAFRYKRGPVVRAINRSVQGAIRGTRYDVIWVDKAIYLSAETTQQLRTAGHLLIHFTPDCAFLANRSRHFDASMKLYDLLVTTKSFETAWYGRFVQPEQIHLTSQGFDPSIHRVCTRPEGREPALCFIGLFEPARGACVRKLLGAQLPVWVGGTGWSGFVGRNRSAGLEFLGDRVFADDYVAAYSNASIGLGFLSKKFPERHTTRTLEIPACGCLLATERTADTERFFSDEEVLFYDDIDQLIAHCKDALAFPETYRKMADAGRRRVTEGGFDYPSILERALIQAGVQP